LLQKKGKNFATFYDALHNRNPLTLDYFLTSQRLGNRITNVKVYKPKGGPISDHHAMRIKLRLTKKLRSSFANRTIHLAEVGEQPNRKPRCFINWKKLNESNTQIHFQKTVDEILFMDEADHDPTPKTLSSAIMTAAKTVLLDEKENTSDWFKMSAKTLFIT
jgi:hypothetical protein